MNRILTFILFTNIVRCYIDGIRPISSSLPSLIDVFTGHLTKYDALFQSKSKTEFDQYDDDEDNQQSRIWESLSEITNLILRPKKYQEKQRKRFRSYSSEASPEKQAELNMKYAENKKLDEIHNRKELVIDKRINNKLHERFQKRVNDNFMERFRPTTLAIEPEEIMMYSTNADFDTKIKRQLQAEDEKTETEPAEPLIRYPKNMDPNVLPDVQLYTIEELYPDQKSKNKALHCQNGSKVKQIVQNYYICYDNAEQSTKYRVDYGTYRNLTTLPYF